MPLKDQILHAEDRPSKPVEVPEWGCNVVVRTMSGAERDSWEVSVVSSDRQVNRQNIRAKLLVRTLYDDAGARVFTDDDADQLGEKSGDVLERLYDVAAKLNGIRKKDIDELEKN